uniref:Uncharacterized protein n=1 Tax=Schistocephalus solidus TaxID=70667 RepID=A0A0X3NMH9_SCHSO
MRNFSVHTIHNKPMSTDLIDPRYTRVFRRLSYCEKVRIHPRRPENIKLTVFNRTTSNFCPSGKNEASLHSELSNSSISNRLIARDAFCWSRGVPDKDRCDWNSNLSSSSRTSTPGKAHLTFELGLVFQRTIDLTRSSNRVTDLGLAVCELKYSKSHG